MGKEILTSGDIEFAKKKITAIRFPFFKKM